MRNIFKDIDRKIMRALSKRDLSGSYPDGNRKAIIAAYALLIILTAVICYILQRSGHRTPGDAQDEYVEDNLLIHNYRSYDMAGPDMGEKKSEGTAKTSPIILKLMENVVEKAANSNDADARSKLFNKYRRLREEFGKDYIDNLLKDFKSEKDKIDKEERQREKNEKDSEKALLYPKE